MAVRGLAIETSGREGSVAAVLDGESVVAERFEHGLKHAAGLVPMIGRVIAVAGWTEGDIGEIYVSIGPGSFTGLRIAVTLAKTWWMTTGAKVVAVPSVRVIAENLPGEARHVVVALDAKRGQVFTASYSRDMGGEWVETRPARLDRLVEVVEGAPKPMVVTGEGLDYHKIEVSDGVSLAGRDLWTAQAEVVGRLGYAMGQRGEYADGMRLSPVYVRLPEAEEKWRIERGEPV